jgi:hypothetical protein
MASRERWFLASVCRHTDRTCQASNAWVSIRRFISVFTPVLIASLLSQVQPISHVSGALLACGQGQ